MTRIIRSSSLLLCVASLLLASPATRAGSLDDPRYASDLHSDSSDLFLRDYSFALRHAPAWLVNALPSSRLSSLRSTSLYDRAGDRTESIYRYSTDVGTLANPFNLALFTGSSTFAYGGGAKTSGLLLTDAGAVPNATTAVVSWNVTTGGSWGTASNWDTGVVPPTGSDVVFSSAAAGSSAKAITLDATRSVNSLTFTASQTGSVTISTNQLVLNPSAANATTISVNTNSGDHTISSAVQLAGQNNQVFDIGANRTFTFTGSISGSTASRGFTKSGTGTLVLSGTNTYDGATVLNAGTTLINGNQSASNGALSVNNAGTVLGGTGTIGGATTVNTLATITGATSGTIGTLTMTSTLTFTGSSTYLVDINATTSDKLAIGGTLDLSGLGDSINFNSLATPTAASYTLATYTGVVGIFDIQGNLPAGYTLVYTPTELDLVMTPVPEPSTWIGAALALGAVGWTQRKRFGKKLTS